MLTEESGKVMEMSDEVVLVNSSRLKSAVWSDFDRIKKGDALIAVCKHCNRKLSGSSTSGTSHLRNHLIRCKKRPNYDVTPMRSRGKKKEGTIVEAGSLGFPYVHRKTEAVSISGTKNQYGPRKDLIISSTEGVFFDYKRSRFDLARMIIIHGYSLNMVEDSGFRVFVRNLQPSFDLVTRDVVEADCEEIYQVEKQKVYEELERVPGKICLCADVWVANPDNKYLSLTAHYIDNTWQLQKKIINFVGLDTFQTEDMLSEAIMTSVKNWDIDRKLFSVTFDSHSNYDNIARKIRDQLCEQRLLVCNGQLFDVRCAANVVKLMAEDALMSLTGISHKIRESVRYIMSSETMQEKFNESVDVVGVTSQKSLYLDNRMHWNSTYIMLETALEYKNVFLFLKDHGSFYSTCPTAEDWARASAINGFLKLFIEMSNVFAGNKFSTANIFFPAICDIHLQLIEWCQNADDFISSLALKMKTRFDEYWKKCSLALAISAVLDPRYKMRCVEYYYPMIYGTSAPACIDIVSSCMKALYNGHAVSSSSNGQDDGDGGVATGDFRKKLTGFDKFVNETSRNHNIKPDLDKYLEEPLFPRNDIDGFSILDWWKVHAPRYPILSMMARNILGIPLSKVPYEILFCTGDREVDRSWSSLKPDTLEALMCTQDWMCAESEDTESSSALTLCYDAQ